MIWRKLSIAAGATLLALAAEGTVQAAPSSSFEQTDTTTRATATDVAEGVEASVSTRNEPARQTSEVIAIDAVLGMETNIFTEDDATANTAEALAAIEGLSAAVETASPSQGMPSSPTSRSNLFGGGGLFGNSGLPTLKDASAEASEMPLGLSAGIFIDGGKIPLAIATSPFGSSQLPSSLSGTLAVGAHLQAFSTTGNLLLDASLDALGAGTFAGSGSAFLAAGAGVTQASFRAFNDTGIRIFDTSLNTLGAGSFSTNGAGITAAGSGATETGFRAYDATGKLLVGTSLNTLGAGAFQSNGAAIRAAGSGATETSFRAVVDTENPFGEFELPFSLEDEFTWALDLDVLGTGLFAGASRTVNFQTTGTLEEILEDVTATNGPFGSLSFSTFDATPSIEDSLKAIADTSFLGNLPTNGSVDSVDSTEMVLQAIANFGILPEGFDLSLDTDDLLAQLLDVPTDFDGGFELPSAFRAELEALGAGFFLRDGTTSNAAGAGQARTDFFASSDTAKKRTIEAKLKATGAGTFASDGATSIRAVGAGAVEASVGTVPANIRTVPEPSSILGIMAMAALGAGSVLKRKQS
jgi:hypothetical protein